MPSGFGTFGGLEEWGPFEWPLSLEDNSKKKKKPKNQPGVYDTVAVFAVDANPANLIVSSDGYNWTNLGSLEFPNVYAPDQNPPATMNNGGFWRAGNACYISGTAENLIGDPIGGQFILQPVDKGMQSADGLSWGGAPADLNENLLFSYGSYNSGRNVGGFVYRVSGGTVDNTQQVWNVVDGSRFLSPNYARMHGTTIQRCANIHAKEDDETEVWETVLSATGNWLLFGPLGVIRPPGSQTPTVVCHVVLNDATMNSTDGVLASRDGVTWSLTLTSHDIFKGGGRCVTFYTGVPG